MRIAVLIEAVCFSKKVIKTDFEDDDFFLVQKILVCQVCFAKKSRLICLIQKKDTMFANDKKVSYLLLLLRN